MTDRAIVLTGATGALGCWLARKALDARLPLLALARGTPGRSADQRVRQGLATIGAGSTASLAVLDGDIVQENLGLRPNPRPGEVGLVVHCAASTGFHPDSAELNWQTNVEGTRRVLAFALHHRSPVVYISTAYVAGRRSGRVREDELDLGQTHHNSYEHTKCQAEMMVRDWSAQTGLPATILRPSIVVGDWQQGRALRFNTLYDMMRAMDSLSAVARGRRLRVVGCPSVTKNIIPVDYFADVAWHIIRRNQPGTYHIVHPSPLPLSGLHRIFTELFGVNGAVLVPEEEFLAAHPNQAERICHRAIKVYRPYLTHREPVFDRTATDAALAGSGLAAPTLDMACFRRLLDYARQVNWGRRHAANARAGSEAVAEKYFETFLSGKLNQALLPDLHRLSARFTVVLDAPPGRHWSLDVQQGVLKAISRNGMPTQCHFTVDAATFREIVSGRLAPQQAFFNRRVDIGGDIELGLKVAAVLAQFFRRFPFESATE